MSDELIKVVDAIPEPQTDKKFLPEWSLAERSVFNITDRYRRDIEISMAVKETVARRLGDAAPKPLDVVGAELREVHYQNNWQAQLRQEKLWPGKTGADGMRLRSLFSGQWADRPLEEFLAYAADAGYGGVELACWHFNLQRARVDDAYIDWIKSLFQKYSLRLDAISAHLVGQCTLDRIDERHKGIVPEYVWADGQPAKVNYHACMEMIDTAEVASRLGVKVVNGFTGSGIWHGVYDFPPASNAFVDNGYHTLTERWNPILDMYDHFGISFALEVHPTEIAFDVLTFERALKALDYRPAFGINFDPSHLLWQGMNPTELIDAFPRRIYHVHMKDALVRTGGNKSVLGSHLPFGHRDRGFDFVSLGRGQVNFNEIIRSLNWINYQGPLSVEWEDSGMRREHGAREALEYLRKLEFSKGERRMDEAFAKKS